MAQPMQIIGNIKLPQTAKRARCGKCVFKACMDYALENGANKLTILSNSILKPALHIYEKYGFYEIPIDNTHHYKRVDIQFEYTAK
ncbi:MAG: hypothetical protein ACLTLI_10375 [Clostridia bacterium]